MLLLTMPSAKKSCLNYPWLSMLQTLSNYQESFTLGKNFKQTLSLSMPSFSTLNSHKRLYSFFALIWALKFWTTTQVRLKLTANSKSLSIKFTRELMALFWAATLTFCASSKMMTTSLILLKSTTLIERSRARVKMSMSFKPFTRTTYMRLKARDAQDSRWVMTVKVLKTTWLCGT